MLIVLLALIFSLASPAALAEGQFKKGCDLYAAGKYSQALPLLEQNAKQYPRYWPGHYYLAHTYLALGQKSAARSEYENCLTCQPSLEVSQSCRKVLTTLGGSSVATLGGGATLPPVDPLAEASKAGTSGTGGTGGTGSTGSTGTAVAGGLSPSAARVEENKKWVMQAALDQCERLRNEMDAETAAANANGRWYYKTSDPTWHERRNPRLVNEIKNDYESRINKTMEDARKKVADMK